MAAAVLLGIAYGICIVAGLVEVQAMADPHSLAGLTGIYYSLTYLGFTLPVILAELAHVAPYGYLLAVLAAICLGCAVIVGHNLKIRPARRSEVGLSRHLRGPGRCARS